MSAPAPTPALDPDGATGRRWAREELQRGEYSEEQTFLERLDATLQDLWRQLVDSFDPQENPWGTVILVVFVLAIVAFIVWRVGRPKAGSLDLPGRKTFEGEATRPAHETRAAAEAAAQAGDFSLAVQERFRAAVATLSERGLFTPGRADTADEVARAIAAQVPGLAAHAAPAAAAFDDVTFGDREASADTYAVVTQFDEAALRSSRAPVAAEGAQA